MMRYRIILRMLLVPVLMLALNLNLSSCGGDEKLGPPDPVPGEPAEPEKPEPEDPDAGVNAAYIDNGTVRLGVDMDRGGSIFHFSESATKRNLLNYCDEGRFIQQSYYGESDGSVWGDKPWVWNPIQGGGSHGEKARIISQRIDGTSINIVSEPVHWASGVALAECEMEEIITLEGRVAHVRFIFRNKGPGAKDHPSTQHELPAVFVDADLPNLVYYNGANPWTNSPLQSDIPGWPNEERTRTEHWAAYVDASRWGIGVYSPGTPLSTTYRHPGPGGPKGGGCSYFAPIRSFAIKAGMEFEYDAYLYIGNVDDIRSAFNQIRMHGWEIDDTNFPKGYFYIKEQQNLTVEQTESSPTTGYTYKLTATGANPSFTTQRISEGLTDCVLSFRYKSSRSVPLSIIMDKVNQIAPTKIKPLVAANDWQEYSFDLGMEIERLSWGGVGSCFQLFLGENANTEIEIKELRIRSRNDPEKALASALHIRLQSLVNELERFEDLTEYFNYTTGYTYLYQADANAGDPYIWTAPRSRAIAPDENSLSFEYKCVAAGDIELFLKVVGGGSIPNLRFAAANDWAPITFDITAGKAAVLNTIPDACNAGGSMRFDINNINGVPMYIRAIRIHK